jgi:hypothetical protein
MKNTLFEFYKPDDTELKKAWDDGIFTFDANVLLNLYRYSGTTAKELFDVLKHLSSKIWLSHQAGYEYLNNRISVIHKQKIAYEEIKNILGKKLEELSNELNSYKKHSTIEADKIKEDIKKSFEAIYTAIEELSKSHPTYEPLDGIREELTKLFNGKTGNSFDKTRLSELFKEGQLRYDNETPPGFKDKNAKKDESKLNLYGDLILWKQIIEKGKEENKPIVLITDDLKEDWWNKFKGETLGPRKELLREFFDETGQKIYIYQADKFLEYANKLKIGKTVKEEAIKEIRDVRIKDEEHLKEIGTTAESIRKLIEQQQKHLRFDHYNKILHDYANQANVYSNNLGLTKIQEYLENFSRLPYPTDFLNNSTDFLNNYYRIMGNYSNPENEPPPSNEEPGADGPKE